MKKANKIKHVEKGLKYDTGKQGWYPLPIVILKPLADVFLAGEKKYATFNCLKSFDEPERRFWDCHFRHLEACQIDPLARDQETGCYHAAQVAFNILMRLYHCQNKENPKQSGVNYPPPIEAGACRNTSPVDCH